MTSYFSDLKLVLHMDEYQNKTGTRNNNKLIRCSIFEALALANGKEKSYSSKYREIWGKDFIRFSDLELFLEKFGYKLNIWTCVSKHRELKWQFLHGLGWGLKKLHIMVENTWLRESEDISEMDNTCWIKEF